MLEGVIGKGLRKKRGFSPTRSRKRKAAREEKRCKGKKRGMAGSGASRARIEEQVEENEDNLPDLRAPKPQFVLSQNRWRR